MDGQIWSLCTVEASFHLASRESQATVRRQQLKVNAKSDRRFIRSTHGRHLPDLRWGTTQPIPKRSLPIVDALDMALTPPPMMTTAQRLETPRGAAARENREDDPPAIFR